MRDSSANIEWSVTPVPLQDTYQITVNQTFETHVPTPVIVTEPAAIMLPRLNRGEVFNGEFTITNYGLVTATYEGITFPKSFGEYDLEVLATIPTTLSAMQKVTVPYRITRRLQTAGVMGQGSWGEGPALALNSEPGTEPALESLNRGNSELYSEVQGYGGGCYVDSVDISTTYSSVICPNTEYAKINTQTTTYTITYYCEPDLLVNSGVTSPNTPDQPTNTNLTLDELLKQIADAAKPSDPNTTTLTNLNCFGTDGTPAPDEGSGGGGGGGIAESWLCYGSAKFTVANASGIATGITSLPTGTNRIVIASPTQGASIPHSRVIVKGAVDTSASVKSVFMVVTTQTSTVEAILPR